MDESSHFGQLTKSKYSSPAVHFVESGLLGRCSSLDDAGKSRDRN